jgi:hypothetical protein
MKLKRGGGKFKLILPLNRPMEHTLRRILNWHKHIVIASTLDVGGSSGIGYNATNVYDGIQFLTL